MKKNLIMSLMVAGMIGLMLTGCGNKPEKITVEVEPTVEATTEVSDSEEKPLIDEEPTVEPAEPTTETATDNTIEVEIVEDGTVVSDEQVEVGDYLSEHGITITPQGTHVMKMADYGTDNTHDREVEIKVETVPAEEGYSDTILTAIIDTKIGTNFNSGWGVYDRYTGSDLTVASEFVQFNGAGGTDTKACVIEVDGKQYDCIATIDVDTSNAEFWKVTVTVHHPAEYDGVVFSVGKLSASQSAFECTEHAACKLADHELFLEDHYFFTASNK